MTPLEVNSEYTAKLDSKRRIVLRKQESNNETLYEQYLVRHLENGVIELRPQKLVDVASLSEETLDTIERSMKNLKEGRASDPVDLDKEYPNL